MGGLGGLQAFDEKGTRGAAFGGRGERINVNKALFLVVIDVDTGGDGFVDEQASVRVEDVSGPAEDGQWAQPVQVGGEWADARVADGQRAAPVLDKHAGTVPTQPWIAGLNTIDLGVGDDRSRAGEMSTVRGTVC